MAQDYTQYLAANVLNEQQIISYRLLSRALKVHVNLAKQMLYDFHRKQNAKKPGSVHATYLVTGTRRLEPVQPRPNGNIQQQEKDGEDTVMKSSPPLPSSSFPQPDEDMTEHQEPSSIRSIMLVKEEHLEQARATFEAISSIHIYSLEAQTLSDVQALTECNRRVAADYASEDPLEAWKQYGTIQNPSTKRRTRRNGAFPPPPAPAAKDTKPTGKADPKPDSKPSSTKTTPAPEPEKKPAAKPAATKRQNSDIFKSFAKSKTTTAAAAVAKGTNKNESQSSTEVPTEQDANMGGFSSDEGGDDNEDADIPAEPAIPNDAAGPGKSKQQRAAELQAMMDQDEDEDEDEDMADAGTDTPAAAEEEEPENTIDKAEAPKAEEEEEEPRESVRVENGRRRGRRRVMKKRTVKDEEGYLVTREEAAWESFSEDEPPAKKAKIPAATAAAAATAPASKGAVKKGAKPGQGNIMSFFGKK